MNETVKTYKPAHPVRMVTATSLFDGHDASINIMRRILQDSGVEVIHLGHNRSAHEIVTAAVEEDAQGIAVSSYQGGHVEFFKYMIDLLNADDATHIKVFGGGGGVILPDEIRELEAYGVAKIYSPEDGARRGLQGIINHLIESVDFSTVDIKALDIHALTTDNKRIVAGFISAVESFRSSRDKQNGVLDGIRKSLAARTGDRVVPVIGVTGTGGSGKSSLTDEFVLRLLHDIDDIRLAIISCDPTRRKSGGALLGDRIRMNAIGTPRVFMRSLATRGSHSEIPDALADATAVVKAAGFDLVVLETAGIGQGDSDITRLSDLSIYVMTSEFGSASQLEKIDMLDYADLVAVNKFEKRGGEDAVRDVRKQLQRNRKVWDVLPEEMPVFGTIASKFNDDGVTSFYHTVLDRIAAETGIRFKTDRFRPAGKVSTSKSIIIPSERTRYLSEISDTIRNYHRETVSQAKTARRIWHLEQSAGIFEEQTPRTKVSDTITHLKAEILKARRQLSADSAKLLEGLAKTPRELPPRRTCLPGP